MIIKGIVTGVETGDYKGKPQLTAYLLEEDARQPLQVRMNGDSTLDSLSALRGQSVAVSCKFINGRHPEHGGWHIFVDGHVLKQKPAN